MKIIVNGRTIETDGEALSYDELLSYGNGPDATVTYKGTDDEGSLVRGESVEIEDGMIFNVIVTDSA